MGCHVFSYRSLLLSTIVLNDSVMVLDVFYLTGKADICFL